MKNFGKVVSVFVHLANIRRNEGRQKKKKKNEKLCDEILVFCSSFASREKTLRKCKLKKEMVSSVEKRRSFYNEKYTT